ncbi:MAG: 2-phosphosulfolactate phosphatase [Bacteroidales bacterium]|nr:2-phosphosulfolactate phosphatase [Bacteroidales bacterium]
MRRLIIFPTARSADVSLCNKSIVVVIDVLRATSVIATALANGAKKVFPFAEIKDARNFYDQCQPGTALLCGERKGHIIPDFHLGNSPLSYTSDTVGQKMLLLSTTNGSLAIDRCKEAKRMITVAFVNITAVADWLSGLAEDIAIVCAGTNGQFSLDDALCAGALISLLEEQSAYQKGDLALLLSNFYRSSGSIREKLTGCYHLTYLESIGYGQDIDYCLSPDLLQNIPLLHSDGRHHWFENL